jgi:glutamine amidotransferase
MCRLLGIVSSELTEFGLVLTEAPRCLATLSREHPDGWGIAIHNALPHASPLRAAVSAEGAGGGGEAWALHRGTAPAGEDRRFHEIAGRSRGHMLVAHIRQKTVGPTRLENTHPFVRDGWVFAHNGTIQRQDLLRDGCSSRRLREIEGDTDSELFFAYVLTRLDQHRLLRLADEDERERANELLHEAMTELRGERIGAFNFLLSDGRTSWAHRFGRSLFVLLRGPLDPVRERRSVAPGAAIMTRWTPRREAVFVASERITDEPWREISDGTLLRIEREPVPCIVTEQTTAASGHHDLAPQRAAG